MNTFDEFWEIYPRRVAKKMAKKAWDKALKDDLAYVIIDGLKKQLPSLRSKDPAFIPHPATWLNGGRWEDDIQPMSTLYTQPHKPKSAFRAHQDACDAELDRVINRGSSNDEYGTGNIIDIAASDYRYR